MKKYRLLTLFILCISLSVSAQNDRRSYEIGEEWVYQYEGPKTHRSETFWEMDFYKGELKKEVLFFKEIKGKKFCVIQENYGKPDPIKTHLYVDENNVISMEMTMTPQYAVTSVVQPGRPFDFVDLKIGEEKEYKFSKTNDLLHYTFPVTLKVKRTEDQTVDVPAGKFENCRRFMLSMICTIEPNVQDIRKTVVHQNTDLWWHPAANGIVKEVVRSGPFEYVGEIHPGYVGKSVLKSYSAGK